MTNIATLNIEIAADVARIKADMDATKRVIGGAMKDVEGYVNMAKAALVGIIGFGSVDAFKGMIQSGINAKAKLYDLSIQTGITVEALSALGKVAKYSDIPLTDVASASNKLSKSLFTQTEDSKGAAQAIGALGINFDKFKMLGADQQMLAVSKAMAQFEDGTGKSAAAMMLFGKTGATLLPFMKDLAEKNELVGKQTTESARQAKEFERNLIDLKKATEDWKNELVTGMLPSLVGFTNGLLDAKKAFGGLFAGGGALTIDMSQGPGAALRRINSDMDKALGEYNVLAAKVAAGKKPGFFSDPGRSLGDLASDVSELSKQREFVKAQQAREALGANTGYGDEARFRRKQLGLKAPDAANPGAARTPRDDYTPLMKSINEKIALDRAEYDSVTKLTEGQKMQAKIFADIDGGYLKLTLDQKLNVDSALQQFLANEKLNDAKKREADYLKQAGAENVKYIEGLMAQRDALQDNRKQQQALVDTYGMTTDELYGLETAKLREAAASKLQATLGKDQDWQKDEIDLLKKQRTALLDTADLRDQLAAKAARDRDDPLSGAQRAVKNYLDQLKMAGNDTEQAVNRALGGMENAFVSLATTGKANFRGMADAIIADLIRIQIRQFAVQGMGGGAGGGGGWLGTAASFIGSFFGGGNSGLNSARDGYYSNEGLNYGGGRAAGGPVSAGRSYLVGEQGPEILRMGNAGGTVIPNDQIGGGGSRPVTLNVINNGQPTKATQSQRETSQGTVIDLVLDAVAADMASGGRVHDATSRRFGLNPGGTTPRY